MIGWKERIGNEIRMTVYEPPNKPREVVGTVYAGQKYRDGIVSIHGYDGKDYFAGSESFSIHKTENTLPDLIDNFDWISIMTKEEFANWLTSITDDIQSDNCKVNYKWHEWLSEEHKGDKNE